MDDREWRRFWPKVDATPGGCWIWKGGKFPNGYGGFYVVRDGKRKTAMAHRWAYERLVGPIPDGLDLDHLCRVRDCVNPAHLEPVTRSVNLLRGDRRTGPRKTHCVRGHLLGGDNLYIDSHGKRSCRLCRLEAKRAMRKRIREDPELAGEYRAEDAARAREYRTRKRGGKPANPNVAKTHCPNGHPLRGENLYVPPSGGRKCRICVRASNRRAYAKRMGREPPPV